MFADWDVKKYTGRPIYRQTADYLRRKIEDGTFAAGERLPSRRKLAEALSISEFTIESALEILQCENFIEIRPRRRPTVTGNRWASTLKRNAHEWGSYIRRGRFLSNSRIIQRNHQDENDSNTINIGSSHLGPGFNSFQPIKEAMATIVESSSGDRDYGYPNTFGLPALREALCVYLGNYGIKADVSEIMITSGVEQSLMLISMGLFSHDTTLFMDSPNIFFNVPVLRQSGARIVPVPMDVEGLRLDVLRRRNRGPGFPAVYVNPVGHNPTGTTMSRRRIHELHTVCSKRGYPIIENDIVRELWHEAPPPLPIKSMDENGSVLYIGSLTKSLYPGLRLGWIVGTRQVLERLNEIKLQIDLGTSLISQQIALELFSRGIYERYMEHLRPLLIERRDAVDRILKKYMGDIAVWEKPHHGFYFWIKFDEQVDTAAMYADRTNVFFYPGKRYDPKDRSHISICSTSCVLEDMEAGIAAVADLAVKQIERRRRQ